MSRAKLSPHFTAAEFDCRDGRRWPPEARGALVLLCGELLEPLRARFGPVRVTSGFRHAVYNRSVGGAADSFHRYDLRYGAHREPAMGVGLAADVVPARGTPQQWRDFVITMPSWVRLGRLGCGAAVPYGRSGFIHLDTGPRRTWAG